MANLNPNLISKDTAGILNAAADLVKSLHKKSIYPEVALLAMIRSTDTAAKRTLNQFKERRGLDLDRLERSTRIATETRRDVDGDLQFVTTAGDKIPLSRQMIVALDEALSVAQSVGEVYIETDHLLAVMTETRLSTGSLLRQFGLTQQAMTDLMADKATSVGRGSNTANDIVADAKAGEVHGVYFREGLLRDLINMLSQKINRHVILIGPDGVGKRTLVYSLGLMIAEGKGPIGLNKLVTIEEAALLDNPVQTIATGVNKAQGGILFIPHIERFFGGVAKAEFFKAAPNVQKALLANAPVIIGTTTQSSFDERLLGASVVEHVQIMRVPEPSEAEAREIMAVITPHIAADYGVKITPDAIKTAVQIAKRYMSPGVPLPQSAEHLLHRAAAIVNVSTRTAQQPNAPEDKDKEAKDVQAEVDAEDVTLAAAQITGIPVAKLGQDERTRYASMVEHIKERIIGQDEAVIAVSRAVKTARVGLKDPRRPIGSFLFLGPTGVGKTELAKALAEFMFGSEDALLEIDMSEYMDDGSVNKLIGAPPGYVGYEGGGQLTDRVRQQPYIVVLFDEVEKANQRVMDVLLQVLEAGRLTDGQGRTANFSETVIILTSNLGAQFLQDTSITEEDREGVMDSVREFFRPEFLNRLDEIVIFNPLGMTELFSILDLLLKKENVLAAERGLTLEFTQAAKEWMMDQNDHPEWGARPLRRIIARFVREPLADFLLSNDSKTGATIRIDTDQSGDSLTFSQVEQPAN